LGALPAGEDRDADAEGLAVVLEPDGVGLKLEPGELVLGETLLLAPVVDLDRADARDRRLAAGQKRQAVIGRAKQGARQHRLLLGPSLLADVKAALPPAREALVDGVVVVVEPAVLEERRQPFVVDDD